MPAAVLLFVSGLLAIVQVRFTSPPLLLIERFFKGGGWLEIIIVSVYGAVIAFNMQQPEFTRKWRRITWTLFSVVFFSQMIIGLLGAEKFLMTGKLHLPVPLMILSGPLYRGQLSVMTLLFLSTIILSGPAWCSQLCYFGAFDNLASDKNKPIATLKNKKTVKTAGLLIIIVMTLLLRFLDIPFEIAAIAAVGFGLGGIAVMIFISGRKGLMVHCIMYCPIGTIVNYLRPLNPFRMYIDSNCTACMRCSDACKYDALSEADIKRRKPGFSCTYCGDCLPACKDNYIKYRFLKLQPVTSRKLWLFLTITLHAVFLALAKI